MKTLLDSQVEFWDEMVNHKSLKKNKLSIVFPVMNQHDLASACIDMAMQNLSGDNEVELVILDNGSDEEFKWFAGLMNEHIKVTNVRYHKSIGVYPTFWDGLNNSTGDIIAFFHSDLVVSEKGWDERVIKAFEEDPTIGLMGFIGSHEIDTSGGRGLGTISNFQGGEVYYQHGETKKVWKGSPAHVHGKTDSGLSRAAVVDGCAMIFRKECLESIKQREDFPPHHFYDRLLSCETMELGFHVVVLGIACDHISGQTVNQEPKYQDMAYDWALKNLHLTWVPKEGTNWDSVIYHEAERQWLSEYRDTKHFIPIRV